MGHLSPGVSHLQGHQGEVALVFTPISPAGEKEGLSLQEGVKPRLEPTEGRSQAPAPGGCFGSRCTRAGLAALGRQQCLCPLGSGPPSSIRHLDRFLCKHPPSALTRASFQAGSGNPEVIDFAFIFPFDFYFSISLQTSTFDSICPPLPQFNNCTTGCNCRVFVITRRPTRRGRLRRRELYTDLTLLHPSFLPSLPSLRGSQLEHLPRHTVDSGRDEPAVLAPGRSQSAPTTTAS